MRIARRNSIRLAALTIAVFLALFLFQVTSHFHANGQDQAACNRCQLAHVGIAFEKINLFSPAPLPAVGRAIALVLTFHPDPISDRSLSRAPPVA